MKLKIKIMSLKEKILIMLGMNSYMKCRIERYRLLGVTVGNDCRIFSDLSFAEPYLVTIGNNVTISSKCTVITHDNSVIKFIEDSTDLVGEVVIGDNCFIGLNSTILPGVHLANGTVVGAGSVVTKSVTEENVVICGNPAKVIGSTSKLSVKYLDKTFNFKGLTTDEKRNLILNNRNKILKR